jgi:transposase-like protein
LRRRADLEASLIQPISFKRHRFPPDVIRYAVWLYLRFTLSIRDVEELLAQRGIEVSREAVRCWVIKFGPLIAANLRRRRSSQRVGERPNAVVNSTFRKVI